MKCVIKLNNINYRKSAKSGVVVKACKVNIKETEGQGQWVQGYILRPSPNFKVIK